MPLQGPFEWRQKIVGDSYLRQCERRSEGHRQRAERATVRPLGPCHIVVHPHASTISTGNTLACKAFCISSLRTSCVRARVCCHLGHACTGGAD
eukprot:COSAG01_NODE_5198_length_4416_cov_9.375029_5_plen_94_part_00